MKWDHPLLYAAYAAAATAPMAAPLAAVFKILLVRDSRVVMSMPPMPISEGRSRLKIPAFVDVVNKSNKTQTKTVDLQAIFGSHTERLRKNKFDVYQKRFTFYILLVDNLRLLGAMMERKKRE